MPADTPVITGYYRYTDIWYEWHSALPNQEDAKPLKAILAHDSLISNEHPLHVEGVNGVQLYMGTFPTGEARLLFSSAQVDYVRYYLHAIGLTKTLIPLPYSDCLLTTSNLRTVSPVVFSDGLSLKNAIKKIDKNNKKLKGSGNPYGKQCREIFEQVRARWSEKKGVWFALDFEAWELDHTLLTEFGWSLVRWEDGNIIKENGHFIVDEHKNYTNTQYVKNYNPANRYKFNFGTQEVVKKAAFKKRIQDMIEGLKQYAPVHLIFHNDSQDLKYLESLEINLEGLSYVGSVEVTPNTTLWAIDTCEMIAALLGSEKGNQKGLEKMCNLLQLSPQNMHNAGNDAGYTMLALEEMASGPPVDEQKEKRWPNQSSGIKIELKPWQEDSDFSDEEGIMGRYPMRPPSPELPPPTDEK